MHLDMILFGASSALKWGLMIGGSIGVALVSIAAGVKLGMKLMEL